VAGAPQAERSLTPPEPERQKREDEIMSEVMALWQQLAADETSLKKFVKAKRLVRLDWPHSARRSWHTNRTYRARARLSHRFAIHNAQRWQFRGLGRLENRIVAARRAPGLGSVLVIVFAKQECRQILEPLRTPPLRCHAICRCEAQQ
jgi:hypothetical protein